MDVAYSGRRTVKCLCDISPNVCASYKSSKDAAKLIGRARVLGEKVPQVICIERALGGRVERIAGTLVGRDDVLKELHGLAADEEVSVIGIYGMGGVGKTALLNKFQNDSPLKGTHSMIIVDMDGCHKVEDARRKIVDILGLAVTEKESEEARRHITDYLQDKRYVLILDGVWEAVKLKDVGVPIGDARRTKSKVMVATRIEGVCSRMGAERSIQVKCLDATESWGLFAEKAGREGMESDPAIRHHAEILVSKCGGLPCALIAFGQEMAGADVHDRLKHAINKLENAPLEMHPMKDVHDRLKRSYENLADDKLKTCLLYCALHPEGDTIPKEWPVDYCIGDGIVDYDVYTEGYNLLTDLKSASMLEPGCGSNHIKMHPMVRISVVALMESGTGKKCLIRAGKGLEEAPEVGEWRGVERISLMGNRIRKLSESPHSPRLLTLLLNYNPLGEICEGFFRSMSNLRVLDLSATCIREVPPEIGELVQLQYLDFCDTRISSLPQELGNLVRLRYFLLSDTPNLASIPEGLIGKLSELRVLYMHKGFDEWRVDSNGKGPGIEEIVSLKMLEAFSISVNTVAALEKLAGSRRLAQRTRRLGISVCSDLKGTLSTAKLASSFKALEDLSLSECSGLEKLLIDDRDEWSSSLPNLLNLDLRELTSARISWTSGCLQKLRYLTLVNCRGMTQLIHRVNESSEDMMQEINVLPSLYSLVLVEMPELESLSCGSRPLAFPSLEILDVDWCPELKRLPLNAKKLRCIMGQLEWWAALEWPEEDGEVKSRFEAIFKPAYPSSWIIRPDVPRAEAPAASGAMVASGKDPLLERLEELVKNDEASVIGIHGMGGVGKTRLLQAFRDSQRYPLQGRFLLFWVDMDGCRDAGAAQKAVAEALGIRGYGNESGEELARSIGDFLRWKQSILFLDNVWSAVDLKGVGIPAASRGTHCKVILGTRLKGVCESMGAVRVKVKCLPWEAAWSLFVETAGRKLVESQSLMRMLAEWMVTHCGGLPLALVSVGCAMAKKTTPESWEDAIATLTASPLEFPGMKEVLSRLKLSYDNLEDDKFRTCFLYCSMHLEDWIIPKVVVSDYCIGEGLSVDGRSASYPLAALKSASLLLRYKGGKNVKSYRMHRTILAVARWIGGDRWLERGGRHLTDAPDVAGWKGVERISLNHNSIESLPVRPDSPTLLTLLLRHNPLSGEICDGFFASMINLRVLDLSFTGIQHVPPEIGELNQLQHLNFTATRISSLPPELGDLTKLRFFGLSFCPLLRHIPHGLLGRLTELRSLRMIKSYAGWKVDSTGDGVDFEELRCLKLLDALHISLCTTSQLQRLSAPSQLANSTQQLSIAHSAGLTTLSLATLGHELEALEFLNVGRCYDLEEVVIDDVNSGVLKYISLWLFDLPKAKLTLQSGSLQCLTSLSMKSCDGVRQLIDCKDVSLEENDAQVINILPNLVSLSLFEMPELVSLSCASKPLAFPSLTVLEVEECPKLKKLPLNAHKLERIHGQASWWKSLEWPADQCKISSKLQSIFLEAYPS